MHELAPKLSALESQDYDVIFAVCFKDAPVVERLLRFTDLVPREKLPPLLLTYLIHAVIRDVGNGTYVFYDFLSIEIVRIPRFEGRQTEGLGQLTQKLREEERAIQKYQLLHLQHIIFSPFTISCGFHFRRIALFKMK